MDKTYFNNAKFIGSYPSTEDLPVDQGSEIAFCGRSNCGKSSILNALTNNKKLAKTSKTPGRTQSINVFVPADIHKKELHQIHYQAWKKGLKSLYYCRSKSIQRAEVVNNSFAKTKKQKNQQTTDYEECLSCQ